MSSVLGKNFFAMFLICAVMSAFYCISAYAVGPYTSYLRIMGNTDYSGGLYGLDGQHAYISFTATVDGKKGTNKNVIKLWKQGFWGSTCQGSNTIYDPTNVNETFNISGSGDYNFEFINHYSGAWISTGAPSHSCLRIWSV